MASQDSSPTTADSNHPQDNQATTALSSTKTDGSHYTPTSATTPTMLATLSSSRTNKQPFGLEPHSDSKTTKRHDALQNNSSHSPLSSSLPFSSAKQGRRQISLRAILCIFVARWVLSPLQSKFIILEWLLPRISPVHSSHNDNPWFRFLIQMQSCMPPAQNIILLLQLQSTATSTSDDSRSLKRPDRAAHLTRLLAVVYVLSLPPMTWYMSRFVQEMKRSSQ